MRWPRISQKKKKLKKIKSRMETIVVERRTTAPSVVEAQDDIGGCFGAASPAAISALVVLRFRQRPRELTGI
jgi:hypothetical protein